MSETELTEKSLLPLEQLEQAAECLRILAHPHRLRMLQLLERGQYSVGELASSCEIPSHMASEHLRLLQRCGLLSSRQEGRFRYYEIAEPHLCKLMACIEARFSSSQNSLHQSDSPGTDSEST